MVSSVADFRKWIANKPADLSAAMASRIALRTFFYDLITRPKHYASGLDGQRDIVAVFRSVSLVRAAIKFADQSDDKDRLYETQVDFKQYPKFNSSIIHSSLLNATRSAYSAIERRKSSFACNSSYDNYAANAALQALIDSRDFIYDEFLSIEWDCSWIDRNKFDLPALLARPLWSNITYQKIRQGFPDPLISSSANSVALPNISQWFERRIHGEHSEWAMPQDIDPKICRIFFGTSRTTWKNISSDTDQLEDVVRQWLELAEKVTDELLELDHDTIHENEFQQNPRAPNFVGQEDWKIDVADHARGQIELDSDGAERRHSLVKETLIEVMNYSMHDKTQATEISHIISKVLSCLGESSENTQPENYIVYSKALRREMRDHLSDSSSKPPFSEKQLESLECWLDADAIYIGLDDRLSVAEKAIYERRFGPAAIERKQLRKLIEKIKVSGVATNAAEDLLSTVLENAEDQSALSETELQVAGHAVENFLRAFGRQIWDSGKLAGNFVRGNFRHFLSFCSWIANHAADLKQQFPVLAPVIDFIKRWLSKIS